MEELQALRIWYYKQVNGTSFLKSKILKKFRQRTKAKREKSSATIIGTSVPVCDNDSETISIDITEDEFLSILSPNGPSCLFCSKNTGDAQKGGGMFDKKVCEACRRDQSPADKVIKIKKFFKMLSMPGKEEEQKTKFKWEVLEDVIITGKAPKPKFVKMGKKDSLKIKDVVLIIENGTPIYADLHLQQIIYETILKRVFPRLEEKIISRTFCKEETHKKGILVILQKLAKILGAKNPEGMSKEVDIINFVSAKADTDKKNTSSTIIQKK